MELHEEHDDEKHDTLPRLLNFLIFFPKNFPREKFDLSLLGDLALPWLFTLTIFTPLGNDGGDRAP